MICNDGQKEIRIRIACVGIWKIKCTCTMRNMLPVNLNWQMDLKGKFSSGREGALASKFNYDFK